MKKRIMLRLVGILLVQVGVFMFVSGQQRLVSYLLILLGTLLTLSSFAMSLFRYLKKGE
jgi:hypothetical protein